MKIGPIAHQPVLPQRLQSPHKMDLSKVLTDEERALLSQLFPEGSNWGLKAYQSASPRVQKGSKIDIKT